MNNRKDIEEHFDILIYKIELHLENWKKTGGGTIGHAIGSVVEKLKTLKEFYKNNC